MTHAQTKKKKEKTHLDPEMSATMTNFAVVVVAVKILIVAKCPLQYHNHHRRRRRGLLIIQKKRQCTPLFGNSSLFLPLSFSQ